MNAQITTYWTTDIPSKWRPTSAVVPADTLLDDVSTTFSQPFVFYLAGTLDNANQATAFAAIGDAAKTEIDSNWVEDVWGLDPTLNIVGRVMIHSIIRRYEEFDPGDYNDQYQVATDKFRIEGVFTLGISN